MKGKISDINDLVTQPLKMFGALLYGPNEYRVNKNFDEIYKQLNQNNDEMLEAQQLNSNIILNQNEVFFNEINLLSPFGAGNNEPRFVIENLKVLSSDIILDTHIKAQLIGMDGFSFKAFAWNARNTSLENYLYKNKNKKINIAGNIRLNEWRGKKEVQFNIEDISVA